MNGWGSPDMATIHPFLAEAIEFSGVSHIPAYRCVFVLRISVFTTVVKIDKKMLPPIPPALLVEATDIPNSWKSSLTPIIAPTP